jgi:O-antigen/teichoic acid export membrane protein
MSLARRITAAVSAMWLSRFIGIALNVSLMPLLFRYLPQAELGIWFLMVQSSALAMLLDFGVTGTLTRRIAFACGAGAGASPDPAAAARIAGLIATARPLYRWLSIGSLLIAWSAGSLTIELFGPKETVGTVWAAWSILCVGHAVSIGTGMWMAVISGIGRIAAVSMLATFSSVGVLLMQAVLVWSGGGLLALAATTAAGTVILRLGLLRYVRTREPGLLNVADPARAAEAEPLLGASVRFWLTELGMVLLLKTDQMFIAGLQDTSQIPAYHAAYTIVFNLALLSLAIGDVANVYLSQIWQAQSPESAHGLILRSMRISLGLMLCGAAFLLIVGRSVITVWIGAEHFVGILILTTFCVTLSLYVAQTLVLDFARATENEIYAPCYLIGGALNFVLTWTLVHFLGLWGVALGTLLAQAATTNWYVLRTGLRRVRIPWRLYLHDVVLPAGAVFGATAACVWVVTMWGPWVDRPIERVVAGAVVSGFVCVASLWIFGLDDHHRQRARRFIGTRVRRILLRAA